MAAVTLRKLVKRFGRNQIIHGVDLDITDGEFVVLVGPSGGGKSTLLRMIAGLEKVTKGELRIGDRIVNDLAPPARGIAMVFQTYVLYPHMTVEDNMGFGLRMAKVPKTEIKARVARVAETLQLTPLLSRRPRHLSGGQRQRVAIGRAIVREPKVFLFDEPLSNLDAELRSQTRIQISKLHRELKTTMIYVTHDQVEAMTLADKIVVLNKGRIEQVGSSMDLYQRPANLFVAGFFGSPKMNFFKIGSAESNGNSLKMNSDDFRGGQIATDSPDGVSIAPGTPLTLGIRPEDIEVTDKDRGKGIFEIEVVERLRDVTYLHGFTEAGNQLTISAKELNGYRRGDTAGFDFVTKKVHLFDSDGMALKG